MDPLDHLDQMETLAQLAIRGLQDQLVLLGLLEALVFLVNRVPKVEVGRQDHLVLMDHRDLVAKGDHKGQPVFQGPLVQLGHLGTLVLLDLQDH